jgi:asparagine synthase (glutamine-hydrolysing)
MCGIAGYASLNNEPVEPDNIYPMMESLKHRGPDQSGFAFLNNVALGNTRLSILDLPGGRQPIYNEDKSVVVVYNGEIYNYPNLRRELEKKGHIFRTNADTEILVHLYEEEPLEFVKHLNGMFAFALYDSKSKRLLLARDRFGIKPLFYSIAGNQLAFASEIKAIKTLPNFNAELDPEGLSVFLGLFYIPDPWTIYKNVKKLPPGYMLISDNSGNQLFRYHNLNYSKKLKITRKEAEDETIRLLHQGVQRQLLSDVPVGVLLSGGLDSSAVLAAASNYQAHTKAFTISFDERRYDEGSIAAKWAKHYKSQHSSYNFCEEEFCRRLIARQKHLDEPYGLWCNVATASLAEHIRAADFKVVLSGDGGDELFMGYPTIHAASFARIYRILPAPFRKKIIKPLSQRLSAGNGRLPASFILKSFIQADHPDNFRTFFGFKEVVRYDEWQNLLTPETYKLIGHIDPFLAFSQHLPDIKSMALFDALTYLDFKVFLPGCSFVGHDNAYMSASVELRVPMLDNDMVDFACSLPTEIRYHPLQPKIVLRRALKKHLTPPSSLSHRDLYAKRGFEIPGTHWLEHGHCFKSLIKRILAPDRIAATGFFRSGAVKRVLDEQLSGRSNNERILQAIMSLSLFLNGTYSA